MLGAAVLWVASSCALVGRRAMAAKALLTMNMSRDGFFRFRFRFENRATGGGFFHAGFGALRAGTWA